YSTALAIRALYLFENRPSPPPAPPSAGKFTGTVVDSITQQRVSGVTVTLNSNGLINTVTDSGGNFTLPDVPPGSQKVNLSLSGYASTSASATSIADVTSSLGNILMTSAYNTGTVSGTIFDPNGAPLSGAAIAVSGSWSGSAVTGADGTFSFSFVTPGDVTITATKSGYQSFSGSGRVYARTTLSISPRLNAAPSQLATGTIIGRVVSDLWGYPIDHLPEDQGVRVTISGGAYVEPDPNNGGKFTISGLAPNTYQVTVGMSGFVSQTFRLIIAPGVTTDLGTIRLVMSASTITLVGKVTDSATGLPIPGAEIIIPATGQTARADFAGTYAIADINIFQFNLNASASGYVTKTVDLYQTGIHGSIWTQTVDISLTPQATTGDLSGRVVDSETGQPLAGATVALLDAADAVITTGIDGIFVMKALKMGVQRAIVNLNGYAPKTVGGVIFPGKLNQTGDIPMSAVSGNAVIRGIVRNGETGATMAGVQVTINGSSDLQAVTTADGGYLFNPVTPGSVTVSLTKSGFYPVRISSVLVEGEILVFSTLLTSTITPTVSMDMQTDKAVYAKGDTVGLTIAMINRESRDLTATLLLRVTAPDGSVAHEAALVATIAADGSSSLNSTYPLPNNLQGGVYSISAELYDVVGNWIGATSGSFGVAVSRITVTPTLPQMFSIGSNNLLFNINNIGDLPVSAGKLTVAIKDGTGQIVAGAEQNFTLGLGTAKALTISIAVPSLPFGAYSLVYSQSDETREGMPVSVSLVNGVAIRSIFDNSSPRVREKATLSVTVTNIGRFAIDSGLTISVILQEAAYNETKNIATIPVSGSTLVYAFTVPATISTGEHNAIITAVLSGGSSITSGAKLVIFQAALALEPMPTTAMAGGTVAVSIANSGGVDTQVAYRLSIYDMTSNLMVEKTSIETVLAGSSLIIPLSIPSGAVDGNYNLVVNYKNISSGAEQTIYGQLSITGVKGSLLVTTGKMSYLPTEPIAGQSNITITGLPLQNGNLHLQVTNATGSRQQRTWTSQFDFQQGVRSGVDTFSDPGSVTLLSLPDNFDDGVLNADRWTKVTNNAGIPPTEESGYVKTVLPSAATAGNQSILRSTYLYSGDFDISVDYSIAKWSSQSHMAIITYINGSEFRWGVYGNKSYEAMWAYSDWRSGPSAPSNGKLRLKRAGTMYYCYYWNGSAWTLFTSYRLSAPAVTVQLWANSDTQGNPMEVRWDNFTSSTNFISSGTMNLKYDGGQSEYWDKIAFNSEVPTGSDLKFRTRSAETEAGLVSASWSNYITTSGSPITSPKGRWLEVETTLTTTDMMKTPVLRDITVTQGHNPGDIFWQTDIPVNLAAGETMSLASNIGTLGQAGKYYLQGVLSSNTGQTIGSAENPFYVVQGNMIVSLSADKKLYKPGTTVTLNGNVTNLSSADAANIALSIKSKATGANEQILFTDSYSLQAGSSRSFSITTTAGPEGIVSLSGTVIQNSAVLATVSDQYEVVAPKVTATLSGPDSVGSDPFALTLTMSNSSKIDALILIAKSFSAQTETITLTTGQTKSIQYQQQVNADTNYTINLSGDLAQQLTKSVAYLRPKQAAKLVAKAVTDKLSYNASEKVAVTTSINCLDAGTTGDILAATVIIVGKNGEVFFNERSDLAAPESGRIYTSSRYWNSAASPPGSYTARLTVEGGGATLATAESTYSILPSAVTAAGITGTVAATVNPLYQGIDQALNFTIMNSGNEDITSADLSIIVINPDTMATMQSYHKIVALARQGTFFDTVVVPTIGFEERDYLAVLQITLPLMTQTKTLAGMPLSVKIAPPPLLQLSTLPDRAITNNQALNVSGSVTSVVTIKSVTINGTDVTVSSDGSFSHALLLQAGDTLITTVATDILGHSATDNRTITLDQTAPTLTIDAPADNSKTAVSPIEVKGSIDETSAVTVTLNGSSQPVVMDGNRFTASISPAPRWNTIEITATDLAGNPSSQKRSVLFDDQKPSLSVNEPDQDIRTNKSSITISGKATDPYSAVGVTVAIDGVVMTPPVVNDI
ncbi:MAG: carboxypeptidase regulatory-like domain-containing protein, partial [Geobacteraceae bacterium]|nr:carboxypeptidase regulatory-like domain-containing protein [Geobacteraceae bacterium]